MQNPHGLADSRIIFPFRNPILRDIKIPIQESSPLRRFLHSIFQIPIPNSQHWHSNSQSKSCIEGGLRTLVAYDKSRMCSSQYAHCGSGSTTTYYSKPICYRYCSNSTLALIWSRTDFSANV